MKQETRFRILVSAAAVAMSMMASYAISQTANNTLAAPETFQNIADDEQRSVAYFTELGKVLTHARCVNCHPAGDKPRQGDMARLHQPPVERGADGHGLASMRCSNCHQKANFEPARMPGHSEWHLAPREMGWEGKTLGHICNQIKDRKRNGNRSLEEIAHHIGTDTLVGWAWAPGGGRQPAPGTQQQAGALVEAWIKTGAACPAD